MPFDIRTLLVATALATTFCAAARFLLWRMHPHVPGLAQWAWAGLLAACALFLIAARGMLPDSPLLSVAQLLMTAGLLTAWDGFRRFLGRRPLKIEQMLAPLALLAVTVALTHVQESLLVRTLAGTGMIALLSAAIGRELLRAPRPCGPATHAVAYAYLVNAVFSVLRGLAALADQASVGQTQSSGAPALALFWWLCFTVAVTLGMALMTGERLQADLDRQASRDPLTGALNRRAFSQQADREISLARRSGQPLAVMMMDLDHFKRINDLLGHAAGDDILCRFVAVAGRVLRTEDVFARFGGEEFVALLPNTDGKQALAAAERLRAAFAEDCEDLFQPQPFSFTASIGLTEMVRDEGFADALRRADSALYRAKEAGRNRCALADARPAITPTGAV